MSKQATHRPLRGVQSLQSRELMAGDVSVGLSNADSRDLEIVGDTKSNSILVQEIATDTIKVRGLDGTRINGRTEQTFRVTDDVRINMGNGNDRVTVKDLNLTNFSHSDLLVDMGPGADLLDTIATDVGAILRGRMSSGADIAMIDESTANSIELDGGFGNDLLRIQDSSSVRDLVANGKENDDLVEIIDSFASDDIRVSGESGDDVLRVIDVEAIDDVIIDGGSGEDDLLFLNATAGDSVRIEGGTNNDVIRVLDILADRLTVNAGTGNDEVVVNYCEVSGLMDIDLGSGNDELFITMSYADRYITDGGSGYDNRVSYELSFLALRYNFTNFEF